MCSSFRFSQFHFVSRKDSVQKPNSEDGFLSVFSTLELPEKNKNKTNPNSRRAPIQRLKVLTRFYLH